ncbi:hypothetical protein V8E51_006213 [Hyaloscypha variabilis]
MLLQSWRRLLPLSNAALLTVCAAQSTTQPPPSQSTACGTIVNSDDTIIFNASLAYECLTSVPFNPAVATSFLQYLNDTFQFQSTLAYLKNPPTSYQQPSVDLLAGLNDLQQGIQNGIFPNEYEFEAALQALLYATHDGHVELFAGALAVFSFGSSYELVSLSIDGVQLPKVYLAVDFVASNSFTSYTPSAIQTINGIDTTTYLTEFAANNSYGTLEPHADWNQLMLSAAQDIQGVASVFNGGATFYPGDSLTFTLENGTEVDDTWLAVYYSQGNTGPLQTGGDFYNFFVLGFYPDSYDPDLIDNNTVNITESAAASSAAPSSTSEAAAAATSTTSSPATCSQSWDNSAYPDCPDIAQPDLGAENGGYVSGYFLNETSISVLSIPSFDEYNDTLNTFSSTVAQFLTASRAANLNKIVIDVQSNAGGQPLLAIDTFKHFFPNIDPFGGSRLRAHHAADVIGQTTTTYFQSLSSTSGDFTTLIASEWVATERLNANTNRTFASWPEFFGPQAANGDEFTTTQRYNLANTLFDEAAVGDVNGGFVVYGYGNNSAPASAEPPYAAEDIIILSDGLCDSACALFMEMMHHEAGVRVVVAGGRPSTGPMQAPSGSRGALIYNTYELDSDISFAQTLLDQQGLGESASFLPNRTEALEVFVTFASINLRDEVRRGDTIPLQFAYDAADCRIFYTPQTVYNYTALWQYAADAIWSNSSLCVAGSTGYANTGTNQTDFVGPSSSSPGTVTVADLTAHLSAANASTIESHVLDDVTISSINFPIPCTSNAQCPTGVCAFTTSCGSITPSRQCLSTCFPAGLRCGPNGAKCQVGVQICPNAGSPCELQSNTGVCPLVQCGPQQGKARAGTTPAKIKAKKVSGRRL